ncbi:MAG TPA: tetratricopeptide repeat protein [Noviherbaspirillum sp.]|uniref:tetratricopeptide repeat protein n=1 Tax=Noviherbaspirillum sp. TaxID=1926288 RepID=UPI002F91DA0D
MSGVNARRLPMQLPVDDRDEAWYAFNAPYRRLRLFSVANIAGIGFAVCVGLTLGFPYKTLEEQLASSERHRQADRLTVEYLKVFLEADPGAHGLRAQLARQLIQLGAFAEARTAMLPLTRLPDARWREEAAWLELDMTEQEANAEPAGSARHAELKREVRAQLQRLLQYPQDPTRLKQLADKALADQDAELALVALRALAATQGGLDAGSYASAAAAALGLGNYEVSAGLYLQAMSRSSGLDARRAYFLDALRTYQSGGRYREAIAAADRHLRQFGDDREVLLFLARLAQAANMPEAAERYAKRLLKLALLMQMDMHEPVVMHASWVGARPATMRVASGGDGPGLPFDEEAYLLSFNIFLANRNLADAHRVAASAVRQRPDSAPWRRRLAEVSEWTNAPDDALTHWMAYARLTGDETAWNNVLRLADSLHDTATLTAAIRHKLAIEPGNAALLDRLLASYETGGEPERALQLLRERSADPRMPAAQRRRELALMAEIAERSGRDAEALDTWRRLQHEFGVDADTALRIATLIGKRGGTQDEAYRTLLQAAPAARPEAVAFWRALAEYARLRQDDAQAEAAYRKLVAADGEEASDLFNLISQLETAQPLAASRAAMYGFNKTGNPRFALSALYSAMRAGDNAGALAFIGGLDDKRIALLRSDARFLAARAGLLQAGGDLPAAERDLRAALALQPQDAGHRAALLWLLIARRDAGALQRALAAWAGDAEHEAALWGPYAAAHMALNRQREALHWFRKPGFQRDDYLWLMSYAEALEATSQPDLAWQIRRHAWRELRKPDVLRQADPETLGALRDRVVALAPLFAGGDQAASLLRALLHADLAALRDPMPLRAPRNGQELLAELDAATRPVAVPPEPSLPSLLAPGKAERPRDDRRMSATVRELALAFALNRDAHDLARAWLVTRFAQQLSRPLWGELSLLLAAEDRAGLDRLLDDIPDWLPMYDRVEAAQRAGRHGLAQTLAFEQLDYLQHDEELHSRFLALTAERPPGFAFGMRSLRQSPLASTGLETDAAISLGAGTNLTLKLRQARQESRDSAQLRNVPDNDRSAEIGLRMDVPRGALTAAVQGRSADRRAVGVRLAVGIHAADGVDLASELGWRQPATESALLRVGALRSGVTGSLGWSLSKTEFVRLGVGAHRFETQDGTPLGTGATWNAEAGTHLRIEYPNLTLRASAGGGNYSASGRSDQQILRLLPAGSDPQAYPFLPRDSTLFGLSLGIGTAVDGRYSRGWRPFADVGLTYGAESGRGLNFSGGIAGSVAGQDTLQIRLYRNAGTAASPQGFTEFGINYFWLF